MDANQTNVEILNQETGDEFTFNAASLVSDVRDVLLDHRRNQIEATVWGKLKETSQRNEIHGMENLAMMLINKIIDVVATADQVCAYVEVSKFAVDVEKGVVTITSAGSASDEMLSDLAHAKGRQCRLTVLDNAQFNQDSRKAEPEPDQPDLLQDDVPEPAPPLDDDEIIDSETGEITTAEAMTEAIKNDPDITEREKAALSKPQGENRGSAKIQQENKRRIAEQDEKKDAHKKAALAGDKTDKKSDMVAEATSQPEDAAGIPTSDPFKEGLESSDKGSGPDDCPYDGGTDDFTKWHQGRNKGMEDIEGLRKEGYMARLDGMAPTRCEWKKGSPAHKYWMVGYQMAKDEEKE